MARGSSCTLNSMPFASRQGASSVEPAVVDAGAGAGVDGEGAAGAAPAPLAAAPALLAGPAPALAA